MRRPPRESAAEIRSMAWAICGRARWTAGATLASSALMMLAISREDLWSRSAEAALGFSVVRWRRLEGSSFMRVSPWKFLFAAAEKQVLPLRQAWGQDD